MQNRGGRSVLLLFPISANRQASSSFLLLRSLVFICECVCSVRSVTVTVYIYIHAGAVNLATESENIEA